MGSGTLRGMSRGLADLHVHLFGAITADDWWSILGDGRHVDWSWYQAQYQRAYGTMPEVVDLLAGDRHDPAACRRWREQFEFAAADAGNFDRFQAKFNILIAGSALARLDGSVSSQQRLHHELQQLVRSVAARQHADGVHYAEQRMLFGPRHSPTTVLQACQSILVAMNSVESLRLALSLPRDNPWPIWEVAQTLATSEHGHLFTAIDFCGAEEGHPPHRLAPLIEDVRRFNRQHPRRALAVLVHVGESFRDKSFESAVRWVHQALLVGADRLGHALALGLDPAVFGEHVRTESVAERRDQIAYDLEHAPGLGAAGLDIDTAALSHEAGQLAELDAASRIDIRYDAQRLAQVRQRQDYVISAVRQRGAVIEVCPTSNLRIAGLREAKQHPLPRFLEAGLRVVVGSDDPGILGTTLANELAWVSRELVVSESTIQRLREDAWRYRSERVSGRVDREPAQ